ncbi:MAG: SagB/ThcOx family dehydrogenase [Anaerolineae bacterium]|nr:SagB/ThcOx family dehydrogenase [Anaerolineae bacterium]
MRFAGYAVLALTMVASLSLGGCGPGIKQVREVAASPPPGEMALPKPRLQGELSLEETLAQRRSVRSFTEEKLTLEEISQLLWAAQGLTAAWGGRTAPSAGALYPLEVYVATANGLYHYVPQGHKVIIESQDDLRLGLWEAGLKQDAIRDAAAVFVITAVYERTAKKYGGRAERYVKLEAGHACQNILLQAVALRLGAVPIGAFYDDQVQAALSLPPDHQPLYLIPVGHPRK